MSDDIKDFIELTNQFQHFSESRPGALASPSTSKELENKIKPGSPVQYSVYGSDYTAATSTTKTLLSGCYDINFDPNCIYVTPIPNPSGILLDLPEMKSDSVIKLVERFWNSEKDYKDGNEFVMGGAAFKAGLMIYGPPGSGKSCTLKIVANKLIEKGGIVFYASTSPTIVSKFLTDFQIIEKNRKCIVILEDLDSLIYNFGESGYLEMLDSAKSIDNVLFIATTNYPDKLVLNWEGIKWNI